VCYAVTLLTLAATTLYLELWSNQDDYMNVKRISLLIMIVIAVLLSGCTAGAYTNNFPGLAADDTQAYLAFQTTLHAIRLSDGVEAWRYPEKVDAKSSFYANPAPAGDQVVVGDYAKILHGLDVKSGAQRWKFDKAKNNYVAGPHVSSDFVFAPSADHKLYAFTLSGAEKWVFPTQAALWSTPVSDAERVYQDHFLYAVNIASGNQAWKKDLGSSVVAGLALNEGVVYAGTIGGDYYAIDGATGQTKWQKKSAGAVWSAPIIVEDKVIFSDVTGKLLAVNSIDGMTAWEVNVGGAVVATPALTPDGIVVVAEEGKVIFLDRTGKIVSTQTVKGKLYTPPVVTADKILVAIYQGDNMLIALDFNGNVVWSFVPPKK
jgi:outer membrane protein assembly factor BamB